MTENNRRAKYYTLTRAGRKQLEAEQQSWDRMTAIIAMVMESA
ncbi:MAG: lineage-specific thermal regulator protein, partial [Lacunisphaera sp.]|nr:lineage-specific thermal regulator protein [Lacunisphaera sp.]